MPPRRRLWHHDAVLAQRRRHEARFEVGEPAARAVDVAELRPELGMDEAANRVGAG